MRQLLALMGDQAVTFVAFAALLAYGVALLCSNGPGFGRFVAFLLLGCSAIWLLLAVTGIIRKDLADWSPAAVLLLAIGMQGHAAAKAQGNRRRRIRGSSEAPARDAVPPRSDPAPGGAP